MHGQMGLSKKNRALNGCFLSGSTPELRKPESCKLPAGPEKNTQEQPVHPSRTIFVLKHRSSDLEFHSDGEPAVQTGE